MKTELGIKSIQVIGRRWFQRTYGNTYNTVEIKVDGNQVAYLPFEYGYGEYYMQRAEEWLIKNGYVEDGTNHLRYRLEDLGVNLDYFSIDVDRKRDL